jgi:hemoglobin
MKDPRTIYAELGDEGFDRLTRVFYAGVAEDPLLRRWYGEGDLEPARRRLMLFLIQFFGGPTTYSDERGHPRLRIRHVPFAIGQAERDAWVRHMRAGLDQLELAPDTREAMERYFEDAATFLVNRREGEPERIPLRAGDTPPHRGTPSP